MTHPYPKDNFSTMADDMPSGLVTPANLNIGEVDASEHADVVVVGFGIAGASAALEAARAGARVIVLERAATYGGTSAMSGGHFYLGGGTAVQVATGQSDSAEQMAAYLRAANPTASPEKIEVFSRDSVEHFGWVEALGFEFERSFYPEKAVIQPGTEGLMYTGNEKVWPFRDLATPAPRGHKVPVPGDMGGAKLVLDRINDRLAETSTAEVISALNADHSLMADQPILRADYFAKARLADPTQLAAVETYLSRTDVTNDEKDAFLGELSAPGTFVSNDLIMPTFNPPIPNSQATLHDTAQKWLNSGNYPNLTDSLKDLINTTTPSN